MSDLPIFPLTSEHKMIRDAARDFAKSEIAPIAAEFDESGEFPAKTIKKMGEMGFMGIEVPEKYGGAEMDTLAYVLALEEICKVDAAHGVIMSVNNSFYCHGILKFGTEEQKERFVTTSGFRRGHWRVFADRADVRFRCGDDENPRCAGRGGLRHQRTQIMGDKRPGGRIHRPVCHHRPAEGQQRHQRFPGRRQTTRPDSRQERAKVGYPRFSNQ
jgi:hypothetical protein